MIYSKNDSNRPAFARRFLLIMNRFLCDARCAASPGRLFRDVRCHQRLQRCLYGRKIFAIQICRADHLRFALFIYAKHTIKREKSQSRLQATLHRRAHGLHSLRPHSPARAHGPSASQAQHLPRARGRCLISLPCFLSEQISELLCIGDVLRTEHFGQVKDPRPSGRYFVFFRKSVS